MTARVSQFGLQNESRNWGLATQQLTLQLVAIRVDGTASAAGPSVPGSTKVSRSL